LIIVIQKSDNAMKYFPYVLSVLSLGFALQVRAQHPVRIVSGMIAWDDGTLTPKENKYKLFTDSLDRNLQTHPKDTTSLFFRALLYLRFNSIMANPDLSSTKATNNLRTAKAMTDRADSLKMKSFYLKVLRAEICRELNGRYAPVDLWRYTDQQAAERKKNHLYYMNLANKYYDELAVLDSANAYDYQKLKVKNGY
jgi:hypothetical protein